MAYIPLSSSRSDTQYTVAETQRKGVQGRGCFHYCPSIPLSRTTSLAHPTPQSADSLWHHRCWAAEDHKARSTEHGMRCAAPSRSPLTYQLPHRFEALYLMQDRRQAAGTANWWPALPGLRGVELWATSTTIFQPAYAPLDWSGAVPRAAVILRTAWETPEGSMRHHAVGDKPRRASVCF